MAELNRVIARAERGTGIVESPSMVGSVKNGVTDPDTIDPDAQQVLVTGCAARGVSSREAQCRVIGDEVRARTTRIGRYGAQCRACNGNRQCKSLRTRCSMRCADLKTDR